MTQSAIVDGLTPGGDALVRVYQKSACGHDCGECSGFCGARRTITVQAKNPLRAVPGDLVTVETGTGKIIGAAALVYFVPLALLVLGIVLGYALGGTETVQAASGILGLAVGALAVFAVNRFVRKDRAFTYTIVDIGEHGALAQEEEI